MTTKLRQRTTSGRVREEKCAFNRCPCKWKIHSYRIANDLFRSIVSLHQQARIETLTLPSWHSHQCENLAQACIECARECRCLLAELTLTQTTIFLSAQLAQPVSFLHFSRLELFSSVLNRCEVEKKWKKIGKNIQKKFKKKTWQKITTRKSQIYFFRLANFRFSFNRKKQLK